MNSIKFVSKITGFLKDVDSKLGDEDSSCLNSNTELFRVPLAPITEGLEQEFNSLDAQREAAENYIRSQSSEGWVLLPDVYSDGGLTGGNMERPGVQRLFKGG